MGTLTEADFTRGGERSAEAVGLQYGPDHFVMATPADFTPLDNPRSVYSEIGSDGSFYSVDVLAKAVRINEYVAGLEGLSEEVVKPRVDRVNAYGPDLVGGYLAGSAEPFWVARPAYYAALALRVCAETSPFAGLLDSTSIGQKRMLQEVTGVVMDAPQRQTATGSHLRLL